MIPIQPQAEPKEFAKQVKEPGAKFLTELPHPTSKQWRGKEYWQRVLPEMRVAYKSICAYCAQWIPHSTGSHSIDHFIPKSIAPDLAYQWSNFRYVSSRFNSRKGTRTILDPFILEKEWFVLEFHSMLIKANPKLLPREQEAIFNTIAILKLNTDEILVQERQSWLEYFSNGEISFAHLNRKAPFIAYELKRQGLTGDIASIMRKRAAL